MFAIKCHTECSAVRTRCSVLRTAAQMHHLITICPTASTLGLASKKARERIDVSERVQGIVARGAWTRIEEGGLFLQWSGGSCMQVANSMGLINISLWVDNCRSACLCILSVDDCMKAAA